MAWKETGPSYILIPYQTLLYPAFSPGLIKIILAHRDGTLRYHKKENQTLLYFFLSRGHAYDQSKVKTLNTHPSF